MSKKDNGSADAAAQARADEVARQGNIREGTNSINSTFDSQFTDDFYKGLQQKSLDYYLPQVDQQYKDAQKQLTFSLARGGNMDSSTRAEQQGKLQQLYDTNKQSIADQSASYANTAKNNVESARADLISALNSTGDASGAASSAINRATVLSQPAPFSPITDMFATFAGNLGTQAQIERNAALAGTRPTHNTGLFGNKNSVVVSN